MNTAAASKTRIAARVGVHRDTGRPYRIAGAYHIRVRDGRIIEHRGVEDALSLMAQVKPAP